jgi:hypothetical protein
MHTIRFLLARRFPALARRLASKCHQHWKGDFSKIEYEAVDRAPVVEEPFFDFLAETLLTAQAGDQDGLSFHHLDQRLSRGGPRRWFLLRSLLALGRGAAAYGLDRDREPAIPRASRRRLRWQARDQQLDPRLLFFCARSSGATPFAGRLPALSKNWRVISAIEEVTGTKLENGQLRIEYCQDTDGFWLEPHVDIPVKKFTALVYLSDDARLSDTGADVYDESPEHRTVATAPYEFNSGMIIIPGKNTWHGFRKRSIRGIRKSIIVNYVSPEWRATGELA